MPPRSPPESVDCAGFSPVNGRRGQRTPQDVVVLSNRPLLLPRARSSVLLPLSRIDRSAFSRTRQRRVTAPRPRALPLGPAARWFRPLEPRAGSVVSRRLRSVCPRYPSGGLVATDEPRATRREGIRASSSERDELANTPCASPVTVSFGFHRCNRCTSLVAALSGFTIRHRPLD
jgi:hypothetical protein